MNKAQIVANALRSPQVGDRVRIVRQEGRELHGTITFMYSKHPPHYWVELDGHIFFYVHGNDIIYLEPDES